MESEPPVIDMKAFGLRPVPEVVALLEGLLERARAGEIRGVAMAASCARMHDASSFEIGDGTIASLVLAIRRLERRLLDVGTA